MRLEIRGAPQGALTYGPAIRLLVKRRTENQSSPLALVVTPAPHRPGSGT